ncbi:restriction endonuclease subunit S [Klebsiella quasipneumoniae]
MAKYKAYPEYKDSGVEWLGDIPDHWKTISISRLFSRIKRTGYTEKELLSVYRDYGVIPKSSRDDNNNKPSEDLSPYQLVEPNDLVMNKMKAWQGSIAISECEGIVSPAYFVYKPNNVLFELAHPRYVHYLLRNPIYVTQYLSRSKGIRVNQWDLDPDEFRNIELLLPDKTEQDKIYCFLDHETAKIDNLIEKQKQLIELLKEKRQAVISHAVTKGLNPDVPMKDSGVEWLGEVPAHWIVSGFKKYLSSIVDYRGKTPNKTDDGILLVTARNIKKGELDYTLSQEFIAPSDYKEVMSRGLPDIGDVLFTTEAPLGEVANVDRIDIALAQRIIKLKGMTSRLDNYYFKYFIMSSAFQQSLNLYSSGSTAQGIKAERFVYLRKLLPPINEQMEIVRFLDKEISKIDILVEQHFVMLSLLQERRTALISAAVTGKIDVRDWVVPDTQNVEETQEATA